MIKALSESGVDTICATPHFYADRIGVGEFLERRAESADIVGSLLDKNSPRILLGAEVRYYAGISRMEALCELCIEDTGLLLLEMPFCRWTEYTQRELAELAGAAPFGVVLAHIERYMKFQNKKTWDRLYNEGLYMQVNADFFSSFSTRRKAVKMISSDMIHFIGSDCHNMTTRPPDLAGAYNVIEKKLGAQFRQAVDSYGYSMIKSSRGF